MWELSSWNNGKLLRDLLSAVYGAVSIRTSRFIIYPSSRSSASGQALDFFSGALLHSGFWTVCPSVGGTRWSTENGSTEDSEYQRHGSSLQQRRLCSTAAGHGFCQPFPTILANLGSVATPFFLTLQV